MAVLELDRVSKCYHQGGSEIQVLNKLSFAAHRGDVIAISGQSGSGKSTLLAIMAGMDRPDSGKVAIGAQDLAELSESEMTRFRGRRVGMVFQQFHLIPYLTAVENVMLPLEIAEIPKAREKAREALASVGLSHRESHLPSELSGGECQRVAIARAFCPEPEFLLADEPSGNLDPKTGNQVMDLLLGQVQQRGMTLVVVTHDLALAQRCGRRLDLRDGLLHETKQ